MPVHRGKPVRRARCRVAHVVLLRLFCQENKVSFLVESGELKVENGDKRSGVSKNSQSSIIK
jgi:hypothetical protein